MIGSIGSGVLGFFVEIGLVLGFFGKILAALVRRPVRLRSWLLQAEFVGVGSLFIVMLTGFFTGAVFTLQGVQALSKVGMESMVGSSVLLAISRELAPVLTSLMVTGRVASAMATELGTMRVTEQIDALDVMAVDPIQYLVVPRVVAGILMVPALTLLFDGVAALGSYVVALKLLDIDESAFLARIEWYLDPDDFTHGLYKSIVFGGVLTVLGCYYGYRAAGGARGVGQGTTKAVVAASVAVFILDYIMTTVLIAGEPA